MKRVYLLLYEIFPNGESFKVITKNISWKEAIENDWRKTNSWQPGWEYDIGD